MRVAVSRAIAGWAERPDVGDVVAHEFDQVVGDGLGIQARSLGKGHEYGPVQRRVDIVRRDDAGSLVGNDLDRPLVTDLPDRGHRIPSQCTCGGHKGALVLVADERLSKGAKAMGEVGQQGCLGDAVIHLGAVQRQHPTTALALALEGVEVEVRLERSLAGEGRDSDAVGAHQVADGRPVVAHHRLGVVPAQPPVGADKDDHRDHWAGSPLWPETIF